MPNKQEELQKLENLANWMDSKFVIPGTKIRFGLDSLLGLIPGVGDVVTMTSAALFITKAYHYNLPWHVHVRILWNSLIDTIIGAIPFFGDVFDVGWKSNQKNLTLLKKHLN